MNNKGRSNRGGLLLCDDQKYSLYTSSKADEPFQEVRHSVLTTKIRRRLVTAISFLTVCGGLHAETIVFQSGFEDASAFSQFYITPHRPDASTQQELTDVAPFEGRYSHRAWITKANRESSFGVNRNHRAYPTIQLHKTAEGPAAMPICVSLQVWANFALQERPNENQWISLATFTDDESDRWRRTVLVNVSHEGLLHLQHVPRQGEQEHIFQSETLTFPYQEWVGIQIELDFGEDGYAKVWMNGRLTSYAAVERMGARLAQAHFGLYAAPSIAAGEVRNDNLLIVQGHCSQQ